MATLNTMRTKGGVFLIVIIAVALIAFLLGDLSSVIFGNGPEKQNVGTINETEIDYQEYLAKCDQRIEAYQALSQRTLTSEEQFQVRQEVWGELVYENLFAEEFAALGLSISEEEFVAYCAADPEIVAMLEVLEENPQAQIQWELIQESYPRQLLNAKYAMLLKSGNNANTLEAAKAAQLKGASYDVDYVFKPYSSIDNAEVEVSDSEIKAYYDSHKSEFPQSSSRDIEYVRFEIVPSAEDYADAEVEVKALAEQFAATDEPMNFALKNTQSNETYFPYVTEDDVPAQYAALAFGSSAEKMYGPVLEGDTYVMARVDDTKMETKAVEAEHILLPAGQQALVDSLMAEKKGGEVLEALAPVSQFPVTSLALFLKDGFGVDNNGTVTPELLELAFGADFANACAEAEVGEAFSVNSQYGTHVLVLTQKEKPVKKVRIATIEYNVEPSTETITAIETEAEEFSSKAGSNYESFKNAIAEMGVFPARATVSPTAYGVNGLKNSSEITRWAYNNGKGSVSEIMNIEGDYVVVALTEVREKGTRDLSAVSSQIESRLRNEKKAEMIRAEFAGKQTLGELATVAGTQTGSLEDVSFDGSNMGVEPALVGAICVSSPQLLSKPVVTNTGVYEFVITDKTLKEVDEIDEKVSIEANRTTYMDRTLGYALENVAENKVVDNRVKFF